MGNSINGTFTLEDIMRFTYSFFKNRFDFEERDVLKSIRIIQVKQFNALKLGEPTVLYRILTFSYPQYKPYFIGKDKRGRKIKFQRKIKHQYESIIEMDVMSLSTYNWKLSVGSGKKWIEDPPQKYIGTIYKKTREKWIKKAEKDKKLKTKKDKDNWVKEQVNNHKKKAKYLDVGDYNSRVLGINGDFRFRLCYIYKMHNHLYGYHYGSDSPPVVTNPKGIIFLTKHSLRMIELLMNKGIIKR